MLKNKVMTALFQNNAVLQVAGRYNTPKVQEQFSVCESNVHNCIDHTRYAPGQLEGISRGSRSALILLCTRRAEQICFGSASFPSSFSSRRSSIWQPLIFGSCSGSFICGIRVSHLAVGQSRTSGTPGSPCTVSLSSRLSSLSEVSSFTSDRQTPRYLLSDLTPSESRYISDILAVSAWSKHCVIWMV